MKQHFRSMRNPFFVISILYASGQIYCTFSDKNFYPWCSYNMFNRKPDKIVQTIGVKVHSADGKTYGFDAASLYPTEFFIAKQYLADIIGKKSKAKLKAALQRSLQRMNDDPWPAFDEIKGAPPCAGRCTGIDLELKFLAVSGDDIKPMESIPLFSYHSGN